VGAFVGTPVGAVVGIPVGAGVGVVVGALVGRGVGDLVGAFVVGALVGWGVATEQELVAEVQCWPAKHDADPQAHGYELLSPAPSDTLQNL